MIERAIQAKMVFLMAIYAETDAEIQNVKILQSKLSATKEKLNIEL